MQLMRQEFAATNRLFRRHDIPFAVLKGFSLYPLFCPDLGMRVTYDFDYLIPASARESARRVLLQAGYRLRREDSGHGETYWCPGAGAPPPGGARLFAPGMPRSVEVHTQLWNPTEDGVGIPALRDAFERRRRVVWNDLEFEVLAPGDALIFQTLHIFRHILHNWCRLAWLLELAWFFERGREEAVAAAGHPAWAHTQLAEAAGAVFLLSERLFEADLPPGLRSATVGQLRPATAIWVQRLGVGAALDNFSANKDGLLLHRHFVTDARVWSGLRRRRLCPRHRPHRGHAAARPGRWSAATSAVHVLRRLGFHLHAAVRYGWAAGRWPFWLRRHQHARTMRRVEGMAYNGIKRSMDATIALLALGLLSPVLLAISIALLLTSPEPVLLRQVRVGRLGHYFRMLKFRTMRPALEFNPDTHWGRADDRHITRLGAWLRRTNLDELPQLVNVLRGQMSLVGPRPERPFFVERFSGEIPGYALRHQGHVGITGWAQVNGWRGDTSIHQRLECDLEYFERWSLGHDLWILARTVCGWVRPLDRPRPAHGAAAASPRHQRGGNYRELPQATRAPGWGERTPRASAHTSGMRGEAAPEPASTDNV